MKNDDIISIHLFFKNGKQEICEKVCENTLETVPSSTSVEMTAEQDPGQPALLLQNGHPPPSTLPDSAHQEDENVTKPSASVDNNDDNVKVLEIIILSLLFTVYIWIP